MRLAALCAGAVLSLGAAHAQDISEEPLIVGMGYETCAAVLAARDDAVRAHMVAQWSFGYASGLTSLGAEQTVEGLDGLDAGMKRFLAAEGANAADAMNARVIAICRQDPSQYLIDAAIVAIQAIARLGRDE